MKLRIFELLAMTALVSCLLGSAQTLAQNAYIANSESNNVSVINTRTNKVVATIVGPFNEPIGVAVSPDGSRVYVTNAGFANETSTVSVINTRTNKVVATVPVGSQPIGVAVTADRERRLEKRHDKRLEVGVDIPSKESKVYVANARVNITNGVFLPSAVSVIDTATNTVVATIPVGVGPFGVAANPDGSKVYVTNNELAPTNLSVIDTATNTVTATIPIPISTGPIYGVAVSPDGSKVYVAHTNPGAVAVIDTATNTVTATIPLRVDAYALAVTPDGKKVYVASVSSNNVSVINTRTNKVVATIPVGSGPNGVAVSPNGKTVYVPNAFSNNVSVIDTARNKVTATISVGADPNAFGIFIGPAPKFAGMPGYSNCHGQSVAALAKQYRGLDNAAAALGFDSVGELQNAISEFCEG